METSEEQFNELLAQLLARSSKMLNSTPDYIPFAILLNDKRDVEIVMMLDDVIEHSEIMYLFQERLRPKIAGNTYVAVCISYVDYDTLALVAHLENYENYCLTVVIPLAAGNSLRLLAEQMEFHHKGITYIFPDFEEQKN